MGDGANGIALYQHDWTITIDPTSQVMSQFKVVGSSMIMDTYKFVIGPLTMDH